MQVEADTRSVEPVVAVVHSEELAKSDYVLKVNNIPNMPLAPTKSNPNPYNLPSTKVKKRVNQKLVLLILLFIFAFVSAIYAGYITTFLLFEI